MSAYTNRYDLPYAYVRAITDNQREPKPRTISVTELLKPPRMRALEHAHAGEMIADVSDELARFFGTAIHAWLEKHGRGAFAEQTLRIERDGWTVHGTPDALEWLGLNDGTLVDWKTTTVRGWASEKADWERQTNLYAHLARLAGLPPVTGIVVWGFLRDWDRGAMARDTAYPRAGIVRRDVPLWSAQEADAFLTQRLALHRAAQEDGDVPECTDEERWVRTRYALVKRENGRATRLFDTTDEARAFAESLVKPLQHWADWYSVERRDGPPIRCQNYCAAAPWCAQWARVREALTLPDLLAVE